MSKVKLVFVKNFVDIPMWKDTFTKDIEVDGPADGFRLIGARIYQEGSTDMPSGDLNANIMEWKDFDHIVGKLLTYVDATFTDPEQRKAHKDIIKDMVYGFAQDMSDRAIQTVDSHTGTKVR